MEQRGPSAAVRPGALSALLAEMVRSPPEGPGWPRSLRPGAVVGRFELVKEVGRGGFGVVWEAKDRELGRAVALKAIFAGRRDRCEERLLSEAEAAARLAHPNIVTLFDVGRTEDGPYLVLELLRGETLARRLEQGPLPLREALRIAVDVAKGLAHAHAHGVIHRDLTPGNVFLCDDGQVKVLDLGLAHAFGRRSAEGGTSGYMAPEQVEGAPEDERTDVFALGVLLFRMLANELPFSWSGKRSSRPAPPLDVPEEPALGELIGRMLSIEAVKRPRDGGEVLSALSVFQREMERGPASSSAHVRPRPSGRWRLAALVVAVVVLGAAAAALATRPRRSPAPPPAPDGRITVAVADFANETHDPDLDGLSGLLITSLEQSKKLRVLTHGRMVDLLGQMGKDKGARLDESLAREVGRRAGARALVLASIRKLGDTYAAELRVLDPEKDEYLFTLREQGDGKQGVLPLIDRLSERARLALREEGADVHRATVKVAEATTASFDAWQHYFRGDQFKEAIRYPEAIAEYRKAIAVDPAFALAHYRIAYLGQFTGLADEERRAEIDRALREVERVPAKERLLIQAWKAVMDGRKDEAHQLYARVVDTYPDDKEALFMAGDLYLHVDRFAEGLPFFERAAALDPSWVPAQMHLLDSLVGLGRDGEHLKRAQAWTAKAPSAAAFRALAEAHLAGGRPEDAVAAARRAVELEQSWPSTDALATTLVIGGRYEEAQTAVRPFMAPTHPRSEQIESTSQLASTLAHQGRRREALRIAAACPDNDDGRSTARDTMRLGLLWFDAEAPEVLRLARSAAQDPANRDWVPIALLRGGYLTEAAEMAAGITSPTLKTLYEALTAAERGEREKALAMLRTIARSAPLWQRAVAQWHRARLAFDERRDAEVIAAADAFAHLPAGEWRGEGLAKALYWSALAHERLGERDEAIEKIDRLLVAWRRADADLALLGQARALRRRLAGVDATHGGSSVPKAP